MPLETIVSTNCSAARARRQSDRPATAVPGRDEDPATLAGGGPRPNRKVLSEVDAGGRGTLKSTTSLQPVATVCPATRNWGHGGNGAT
jgi:hypothetical protein